MKKETQSQWTKHSKERPSLPAVACKTCGVEFPFKWLYRNHLKVPKKYCSKHCSVLAQHKRGELGFEHRDYGKKGNKNLNWRGDKVGYTGIHTWLKEYFGQPNRCENPKCEYKNIKQIDWALINGKEYRRRREFFWRLCRGCHRKYDNSFRRKNTKKCRSTKKLKLV